MPLQHRADIDGLRGIAVLVILLFHGKFEFFSGGFVGVDIFFVISGFLITSLILKDVSSGTFSIAHFFARRIRRIFPALFVVILAVTAAGYWLLPPDDLSNLGTSQIYTALFASNIHFWRLSLDYFSDGRLYPLLHTWSLGVEEQFYLLAPVAIAFLLKRSPKNFAGTAALGALLSLFSFVAGSFIGPLMAFYLAPFRAWEFLAGTVLASGAIPLAKGRRTREFASLAGLAVMLAATLGTSNSAGHSVLREAAAVTGTCLLIWSGTGSAPFVNRWLGHGPLASVGLISYSLYLWHWPLLVFLRALLTRPLTWQESSLALAASMPVAYLSWRFVELPLRSKGFTTQTRPAFRLAGLVTLAVLALGFALRTGNGMPGRFSPAVQRLISEAPHPGRFTTPDEARRLDFPRIGGKPGIPPTFLVWGDSHAGAVEPAFIRLAGKYNAVGLIAAYPSCPPVLAIESFLESMGPIFTCKRFNAAVARSLAKYHVRDVILVAYWSRYELDDRDIKEGLKRSIRTIQNAGARPWLLEQPPLSPFHPQERATHMPDRGDLESWFSLARAQYETQREKIDGALAEIARTTNLNRLDPAPSFCDAKRCYTALEGKLLYRDTHHLNGSGAVLLLPVLERIFGPR